jgi:hypothetical protein
VAAHHEAARAVDFEEVVGEDTLLERLGGHGALVCVLVRQERDPRVDAA